MAEMIGRARYRGWTGARRPARRGQDALARFGSRLGAGWVAAALAIVLLWWNNALAAEPRVLLLRGWFGVFSTGLDGLADELKAKGVNVEVAGHLYWETALSDILQERATGKIAPLVLVGHSQGANNVIDMARALAAHNIPVDLLVTLAPFMQSPIPNNVVRAINYYQSPGWGAPLTTDDGFRGKLSNIDVSNDWTITHISIDKSPRIHADIAREVVVLSQGKEGVTREGAADAAISRNQPGGGALPR
jgi:hypothetical protein